MNNWGPLVIDVETMPNTGMELYLPEAEAPSNYKDPDKIAAYKAEKRNKQVEGMALDVDLCRIVAIGFAGDLEIEPGIMLARTGDEERHILTRFWDMAQVVPLRPVVGYNILGFDLPIILRRSFLLGVSITRSFDMRRYSSSDVVDLMQLLYNWGQAPGQTRGLKVVAQMFGIPNPLPDVDGSMVATMGDSELMTYCANDVRLTQELARRTRGWYWR